ncbi:alpha/beta fold hydrolase [Rhodoblastus sp.]|uniref:alpha/beta hydrolase n=1 Tax=Rhodoblastus sp. TaxID=1962975 RepID=UPI0025FD11A6|nr:alpha/beta fold hydrolase [Rhodoblastus sp.]
MRLELISKYPACQSPVPPLLFVHAAWHGAWCWDVHFLDFFSDNGFEAHALSLRGHGQSEGRDKLRWTGIGSYVEDVAEVARQMARPPIVIGHSLGGFVVQVYLETHAVPAGILVAAIPPTGVLRPLLRAALRHPWIFLKTQLTQDLYHFVATPELAREAFFSSGISNELVEAYWRQLQNESFLAFLSMCIGRPRPTRVKSPMLVLGARKDATILPSEIEATARVYGTTAQIFPGMAHDMMLEPLWKDVANAILAFATAIAGTPGPPEPNAS